MACIPAFIGAIVFTIVQAFVFLLVLIGTPLPQFRTKKDILGIAVAETCVTLFGGTKKCNGSDYAYRNKDIVCKNQKNTMNAGAAFSIISIATTLVALIFGILMIIKIKCIIIVPFVFVSLSIVTILITWATVASTKSLKMCGIDGAKYAPQKYATYGAGFALMVTAWCLQVLNLVLLIIVACC